MTLPPRSVKGTQFVENEQNPKSKRSKSDYVRAKSHEGQTNTEAANSKGVGLEVKSSRMTPDDGSSAIMSDIDADTKNEEALKWLCRTISGIVKPYKNLTNDGLSMPVKAEVDSAFEQFLSDNPALKVEATFRKTLQSVREYAQTTEQRTYVNGKEIIEERKRVPITETSLMRPFETDDDSTFYQMYILRASIQLKQANINRLLGYCDDAYSKWLKRQKSLRGPKAGGAATAKWAPAIGDFFEQFPSARYLKAIDVAVAVFEKSGSKTGDPRDVSKVVKNHPLFKGPTDTGGSA